MSTFIFNPNLLKKRQQTTAPLLPAQPLDYTDAALYPEIDLSNPDASIQRPGVVSSFRNEEARQNAGTVTSQSRFRRTIGARLKVPGAVPINQPAQHANVQAANPDTNVFIDLQDLNGRIPTEPEVAQRIYKSLGFNDAEAQRYADQFSQGNVSRAFYKALTPDAMQRLVARADQNGRVAIPQLTGNAFSVMKDFLALDRRKQADLQRQARENEHLEELRQFVATATDEEKQMAMERIASDRPLTDAERAIFGVKETPVITDIGTIARSSGKALGDAAQGFAKTFGNEDGLIGSIGKSFSETSRTRANIYDRTGTLGDVERGVGAAIPALALRNPYLMSGFAGFESYGQGNSGVHALTDAATTLATLKAGEVAGKVLTAPFAGRPAGVMLSEVEEQLIQRVAKAKGIDPDIMRQTALDMKLARSGSLGIQNPALETQGVTSPLARGAAFTAGVVGADTAITKARTGELPTAERIATDVAFGLLPAAVEYAGRFGRKPSAIEPEGQQRVEQPKQITAGKEFVGEQNTPVTPKTQPPVSPAYEPIQPITRLNQHEVRLAEQTAARTGKPVAEVVDSFVQMKQQAQATKPATTQTSIEPGAIEPASTRPQPRQLSTAEPSAQPGAPVTTPGMQPANPVQEAVSKYGGTVVDLTNPGSRPVTRAGESPAQPAPIAEQTQPVSKTFTLEDSGAVRRSPDIRTEKPGAVTTEKPAVMTTEPTTDSTQYTVKEETALQPIKQGSVAEKLVTKAKAGEGIESFKGDYVRVRSVAGRPVVILSKELQEIASDAFGAGEGNLIEGAYTNLHHISRLQQFIDANDRDDINAELDKAIEIAQKNGKVLFTFDVAAAHHESQHGILDDVRKQYGKGFDIDASNKLRQQNPAEDAAISKITEHLAVYSDYREEFEDEEELALEETLAHLAGGTKQWQYAGLDADDDDDFITALLASTHIAKVINETHKSLPDTDLDSIFESVVAAARPGVAKQTLAGAFENVRRTKQSTQPNTTNQQRPESRTEPGRNTGKLYDSQSSAGRTQGSFESQTQRTPEQPATVDSTALNPASIREGTGQATTSTPPALQAGVRQSAIDQPIRSGYKQLAVVPNEPATIQQPAQASQVTPASQSIAQNTQGNLALKPESSSVPVPSSNTTQTTKQNLRLVDNQSQSAGTGETQAAEQPKQQSQSASDSKTAVREDSPYQTLYALENGYSSYEPDYARKPKAIETAKRIIKSDGHSRFRKETGRSFDSTNYNDYDKALSIAQQDFVDFYSKNRESAERASEWYNKAVQNMESALKIADSRYENPDLLSMFKLALAITSPATPVSTNFQYAFKMAEGFDEKTGQFPTRQKEQRADGEFKKFGSHTRMIERVNKFLAQFDGDYSAALSHLLDLNPSTGEHRVISELGDWKKIGRFYLNLEGIGSEVTVDLHIVRWWRLLTGKLLTRDKAGDLVLNEEPANPKEAKYIRDFLRDLTRNLNSNHGFDLDVAGVQAVLWYAVQQKFGKTSNSVDFGQVAENFLPKYIERTKGIDSNVTRERIRQATRREQSGQQRAREVFSTPATSRISEISANRTIANEGREPVRYARTVREVAENLDTEQKQTLAEQITILRKVGLLTGIQGVYRDVSSQVTMGALEELSRIPASVIDLVLSQATGNRTVTAPSITQSLKSANDVRKNFKKIFSETFKGDSSAMERQKDAYDKLRDLNTRFPILNAYAKFVFSLKSLPDQLMKAYALMRSLQMQAEAWAKSEAIQGKITKSDIQARITEILEGKNINAGALKQMQIWATEDAEFSTFQGKNKLVKQADKFVAGLQKDYESLPIQTIYETVAPFRNIPANVIARAIDYSPVGWIKTATGWKKWNDSRKLAGYVKQNPDLVLAEGNGSGKPPIPPDIEKLFASRDFDEDDRQRWARLIANGIFPDRKAQKEFAEQFGRSSWGTGFWLLGIMAAAKMLMTGFRQEDQSKRNLRQAANIPDASLRIPGTNIWLDVKESFGALGFGLVAGAELYEKATEELSSEDKRVANLVNIVGDILSQHNLVKANQEFLEDVTKPGTMLDKMKSGGANTAASFIPTGIKDIAEITDSKKRAITRPGDELLARIPFARKRLPEATDALGRPVENSIATKVLPFAPRVQKNDAVTNELLRTGTGITQPTQKTGESRTDLQRRRAASGTDRYKSLQAVIESPEYQQASEPTKKAALKNAIKGAGDEKLKSASGEVREEKAARVVQKSSVAVALKKVLADVMQRQDYAEMTEQQQKETVKEIKALYGKFHTNVDEGSDLEGRLREMAEKIVQAKSWWYQQQ
jgi:hypothetical protein